MNRIDVYLPLGVEGRIVGCLYESTSAAELGQDMAEVQLPGGVLIDAGWYPDGDPTGKYVVSVTAGLKVIRQFRTPDAREAAEAIARLAQECPKYRSRSIALKNGEL